MRVLEAVGGPAGAGGSRDERLLAVGDGEEAAAGGELADDLCEEELGFEEVVEDVDGDGEGEGGVGDGVEVGEIVEDGVGARGGGAVERGMDGAVGLDEPEFFERGIGERPMSGPSSR